MSSTAEAMTVAAVTSVPDSTIVAEATTETVRRTHAIRIVGIETLTTAIALRIGQAGAATITVATSIVRPLGAIPTTRPPTLSWSNDTRENSTRCNGSKTPNV